MLDSFLMFTFGYLYGRFFPRLKAKWVFKRRLRRAAKIMKRADSQ